MIVLRTSPGGRCPDAIDEVVGAAGPGRSLNTRGQRVSNHGLLVIAGVRRPAQLHEPVQSGGRDRPDVAVGRKIEERDAVPGSAASGRESRANNVCSEVVVLAKRMSSSGSRASKAPVRRRAP